MRNEKFIEKFLVTKSMLKLKNKDFLSFKIYRQPQWLLLPKIRAAQNSFHVQIEINEENFSSLT